MRIALSGNPNSGKTTMYNALTGSSEKVGNWAGVTVDKNERPVKRAFYTGDERLIAVDLPGAYSMSPFTGEESITRDYVRGESPDVIVNIVDSTNLGRSLFFTTQLLELGIPTVVALNKSDLNRKQRTSLDPNRLSELLGCPVLSTVSTSQEGLLELVSVAMSLKGKEQRAPFVAKEIDPSDPDAVRAEDRRRFAFVNSIVREVEQKSHRASEFSLSDRIDLLLTGRGVGILFFSLVMFLVVQISQVWVGGPIADLLVGFLEQGQEAVRGVLSTAHPLLVALLVDGVIGGVIAVLGFLPLVMVMYFLIALLEDCGYLSRVAVVLDPIFKKVGLSGKSVIPFVISVGCAVPGIMASRTIKDERERRAAAMLAPFMPCGAKIPVIALFAGAFFDGAGWVSTVTYLSGILLIFLGALLVNRVTGNYKKRSYFIIEMPAYKFPSIWGATKSMLSRGKSYVVKAATVILLCNTVVQIMQSFTLAFAVAETADASILAAVAKPFSYLFYPLVGVLSWQLAAATLTGFIAKENVVGTLAVCFVGLENLIDTEELVLLEGSGAEAAGIFAITKVAALAYLMFNLYSPPCFAALGAMNAEVKSAKWFWGGVGLQLGVGYTVSYLVYTIGTLIISPETLNVPAALLGLAAVFAMAAVVLTVIRRGDLAREMQAK